MVIKIIYNTFHELHNSFGNNAHREHRCYIPVRHGLEITSS